MLVVLVEVQVPRVYCTIKDINLIGNRFDTCGSLGFRLVADDVSQLPQVHLKIDAGARLPCRFAANASVTPVRAGVRRAYWASARYQTATHRSGRFLGRDERHQDSFLQAKHDL